MKNSNPDIECENLQPPTQIGYALPIDEHLYNRIEKLIRLLNHVDDKKHTRQRLVIDAFLEKLGKNQKIDALDTSPEIPKKRLRFAINARMYEKIEKEIQTIKKTRRSYSKQEWFTEAINEKLDKEEKKAQKLLEKTTNKQEINS